MTSKPFSVQSPTSIAMEYGGNKQKIAAAAQSGIVDPTAAVLAGMFIDRMRAAQSQEQAPSQTVAQQVFATPTPSPQGGLPPGPPTGMPQGGIGATPGGPPATPPMAPSMGGPPPPAGMATGGMVDLPVPDNMFGGEDDEYASGGIVAFAGAGEVKKRQGALYDLVTTSPEELAAREQIDARREVEGKVRAAKFSNYWASILAQEYTPRSENPANYGAPKPAAKPTAAKPATRATMSAEEVAALRKRGTVAVPGLAALAVGNQRADTPTAAPSSGGRRSSASMSVSSRTSTSNPATAGGLEVLDKANNPPAAAPPKAAGLEENRAMLDKMVGVEANPDAVETKRLLREGMSAEAQKKDRKRDFWMGMAQIGANMAATNSPYFLQAAGQAVASALPGMAQNAKERKAQVRADRKELASLNAAELAQAQASVQNAINYTMQLRASAQGDEKLALDERLAELRERGDTLRTTMQINAQRDIASMQARASVAAANARGGGNEKLSDFKTYAQAIVMDEMAKNNRLTPKSVLVNGKSVPNPAYRAGSPYRVDPIAVQRKAYDTAATNWKQASSGSMPPGFEDVLRGKPPGKSSGDIPFGTLDTDQ